MVNLKVNENIVNCDRFIEMSADAVSLYFYLLMEADSEGMVSNVKATARKLWQEDEDAIGELVKNRFIKRISETVYKIGD